MKTIQVSRVLTEMTFLDLKRQTGQQDTAKLKLSQYFKLQIEAATLQ
jgi:hypothetical protein